MHVNLTNVGHIFAVNMLPESIGDLPVLSPLAQMVNQHLVPPETSPKPVVEDSKLDSGAGVGSGAHCTFMHGLNLHSKVVCLVR